MTLLFNIQETAILFLIVCLYITVLFKDSEKIHAFFLVAWIFVTVSSFATAFALTLIRIWVR
jgi:hypothetical protein